MPPQQGPSPPARGKAHSSPDALCAVPSTTGNAAAADHTKRVCRGSGEKLNGALPAGPAEKIEERQQKTAGRSYGSAVRSAGFPGRKELSGNDNPRSIWTVLPLHRITAHLPGGECTRPLSGRLGRPDIMTVAPGGPPRRRCTARGCMTFHTLTQRPFPVYFSAAPANRLQVLNLAAGQTRVALKGEPEPHPVTTFPPGLSLRNITGTKRLDKLGGTT